MKISVIGFDLPLGKANVKDPRLDQVDAITKAKKKTYVQVELVDNSQARDCDAILICEDMRADLVLGDLEFVETRLSRTEDPKEKELLGKIKTILEREEMIFSSDFSDAEKQEIIKYGMLTAKPVTAAKQEDVEAKDVLLAKVLATSGYISFFTTGEKETRAWLIKKGTTAWEAAGTIHSDIQQGFIRAEIIAFTDFTSCGGESQAKQAGKLRLEQKDYVMQDCDLTNFRFNK